MLSSRLSVEAREPRLLLSADVAPVGDVMAAPIEAVVTSREIATPGQSGQVTQYSGVNRNGVGEWVSALRRSSTVKPIVIYEDSNGGATIPGPKSTGVASTGVTTAGLTTQVAPYRLDIEGRARTNGLYAYQRDGLAAQPARLASQPARLVSDIDKAAPVGGESALTPGMGEATVGDSFFILSGDAPEVSLTSTSTQAVVVPPIRRALTVPGATEIFSFTLTETKKIYCDSLIDRTDTRWSLTGPDGKIVDNRAFGSSDSTDIAGSNVLDLAAGEYRLTVDGVGDATGDYSFRLLDITNATSIAPGTLVAGHNEGRLTDLYAFDVVAGQRFFFDRRGLSGGNVSWRLIGPDGESIRGPESFNDSGIFTLNRTGTYRLAIEGRSTNTAPFDYSFSLSRVTDDEAGLEVGELVDGQIVGPGDTRTYVFDLASDARLFFDSLRQAGNLHWTLVGPRGKEVESRYFTSSDGVNGAPHLSLVAGQYRLTVAGAGDATGDFAFRLLDASAAADVTGLGSFGEPLGDGGASAAIERGSGAPLDYSGQGGAENHGWSVSRLGELTVPDSEALRSEKLTLEAWIRSDDAPGTGNYYQGILFKGSSGNWADGYGLVSVDGAIRFYVNSWSNIFVEAPLSGNDWTHVAATYDGAAMRLYMNGVLVAERAYSGAINHSTAPLAIGAAPRDSYRWNGAIDEARIWNVARSATEISAAASIPLGGGETGLVGYWRFDEASGLVAANSVGGGAPASGAIAATETRLYRFTAAKGESWYFDLLSQSSSATTVRVYRPDGLVLVGPNSLGDISLDNLPMDGVYLVAVEGSIYSQVSQPLTARMVKAGLKRVPVVDEKDKLVGMLSRLDILHLVANAPL